MKLQKRFPSLSAASRQLLFPIEFLIDQPAWSDDWLEALRKLADLPPPPSGPDDNERIRFLADLATTVWRLRSKMVKPGTERPKEQFRREYRHLESAWDVVTLAGMEIQDHTGDLFDSGQALKVLAFQPTYGVQSERVQETVKPTIYFKGRHIQMGELFVVLLGAGATACWCARSNENKPALGSVLPEASTKEYPRIKEPLAQGWTWGERPNTQ